MEEMYKNSDLSLSQRSRSACETLAQSDDPLKERLRRTVTDLLPVILDRSVTHYRTELDQIHDGLEQVDDLDPDRLKHLAAKIVALAFQVCQDTEASFHK
jgi:hypothetical protein